MRSNASIISRIIVVVKALSCSGRFSVIVATWSIDLVQDLRVFHPPEPIRQPVPR